MAVVGDIERWLIAEWPRAGALCAVVLAALLPAFWTPAAEPFVLAASLLPVYMVHQLEEHGRGRFVAAFNATIGGGLPVLTARSACWINLLGVWALTLLALALSRVLWAGWLLVPVWLTLANGLIHVAGALREHGYNPGLATATLLFLPWGGFVAVVLSRQLPDPLQANGIGLLIAVAVHLGIVAYALRRKRILGRGPAALMDTMAADAYRDSGAAASSPGLDS
jgi:hypothetical protein